MLYLAKEKYYLNQEYLENLVVGTGSLPYQTSRATYIGNKLSPSRSGAERLICYPTSQISDYILHTYYQREKTNLDRFLLVQNEEKKRNKRNGKGREKNKTQYTHILLP